MYVSRRNNFREFDTFDIISAIILCTRQKNQCFNNHICNPYPIIWPIQWLTNMFRFTVQYNDVFICIWIDEHQSVYQIQTNYPPFARFAL